MVIWHYKYCTFDEKCSTSTALLHEAKPEMHVQAYSLFLCTAAGGFDRSNAPFSGGMTLRAFRRNEHKADSSTVVSY